MFITNQIVVEVNRNKLKIFLQTFENYIKSSEFKIIDLPDHFEDEDINEWNKKNKIINEYIKNQKDKLDSIFKKMIDQISLSKDSVSIKLNEIFSNPIKYSEKELINARLRKELGNPPGKKGDPLGDQLNWEQLLSKISSIDELWIVTKDSDYYYVLNENLNLIPFLSNELKSINNKLEIKFYNKLSDAIKDYNEFQAKLKYIPEKDVLEKISEEEIDRYLHFDNSTGKWTNNTEFLNNINNPNDFFKVLVSNDLRPNFLSSPMIVNPNQFFVVPAKYQKNDLFDNSKSNDNDDFPNKFMDREPPEFSI